MTAKPRKQTQKSRVTKPTQTDTWTVRGVDHEARTAALVASRRAGQTVGEWVTRAIQEHAKSATAVPAIAGEDTLKAILDHLAKRDQANEALADRLARLERSSWLTRLFGR